MFVGCGSLRVAIQVSICPSKAVPCLSVICIEFGQFPKGSQSLIPALDTPASRSEHVHPVRMLAEFGFHTEGALQGIVGLLIAL